MKRFMFLSIGVLCLAIAALIGSHIGSQNAKAQPNIPVVGFSVADLSGDWHGFLMQPNGDVYNRRIEYSPGGMRFVAQPAFFAGNFWEGATATNKSTWGGVKDNYKK